MQSGGCNAPKYLVLLTPPFTLAGHIAKVQLHWENLDRHKVTKVHGNLNTWDLVLSIA